MNARKTFFILSFLVCLNLFAQSQRQFVSPANVKVSGIFATALNASADGRLKYFITGPESRAIRIYSQDTVRVSKSEGWEGECAGKWLYATAKAVERSGDETLKQNLKNVADYLVSQQYPDGYLGTFNDTMRFSGNPVKPKQSFDLWMNGYVMQGLIETCKALNNEAYLTAAKRIGDLCIQTFGEGRKSVAYSGGWRGMASACVMEHFVDLYNLTKEKKYLDFAKYCLEEIERRPDTKLVSKLLGADDVSQIGEGKMYEMLHCLVGVAKLYRIQPTTSLKIICDSAWAKIGRHINAAGGPSGGVHVFLECYDKAGFFSPYSYNETCATMDWLRFNKELLGATGVAKYAEDLEKTTYNALLGAAFKDGYGWAYHSILNGWKERTGEFACCSSSGTVLLEEVPEITYSVGQNAVSVNLLMPSEGRVVLNGQNISLKQQTTYPFEGSIALFVNPATSQRFTLRVRIPDWAKGVSAKVNSKSVNANAGTFLTINRKWSKGDKIVLNIPMRLRRVDKVAGDTIAGRPTPVYASFYRGPLLYATSWKDTKEQPAPIQVTAATLSAIATERTKNIDLVVKDKNGNAFKFQPYATITSISQNAYHTVWVQKTD